jgi:hypothetical protein
MAREIAAPDGRRWRVRRRWLSMDMPRWRGSREDPGGWDVPGGELVTEGPFAAIAIAVLAVVFIALFFVLIVPAVVFLVELLVVLLVAGLAIAGRIVLRRPWLVEARSDAERESWPVVGWRASGRAVDAVAEAIERGESPSAALTRPEPVAGLPG